MKRLDRTELSPQRVHAARRQLENIVAGQVKIPRRTMPAKIALTVGAACAISIAAATIPNYNAIADKTYVECRTTLDPDEFGNGLAELTPFDPNSGHDSLAPISDPISACRAEWQRGRMSNPTLDGTSPIGTLNENPAPSLVLCVAKDGHAVVVPSSDPAICGDLKLAQPAPAGEITTTNSGNN